MRIDSIYFFPEFMLKNEDFDELLKVCQKELDRFFKYIENLRDQITISDASLYLNRYEKMFGISVNKSLSDEERIKRLLVKLNTRTNATVEAIETVISSLTGCNTKITEVYDQYAFTVEINNDRNKVINFEDVRATVETIKPAHLSYILYLVDNYETCSKVAITTLKSKILYFEEVK